MIGFEIEDVLQQVEVERLSAALRGKTYPESILRARAWQVCRARGTPVSPGWRGNTRLWPRVEYTDFEPLEQGEGPARPAPRWSEMVASPFRDEIQAREAREAYRALLADVYAEAGRIEARRGLDEGVVISRLTALHARGRGARDHRVERACRELQSKMRTAPAKVAMVRDVLAELEVSA